MSARNCTSHCAACGSCFHSDEAFDLHRGGDFRDGSRFCWPEDAEERLEHATESGVCELGGPVSSVGVRVWRRKRSTDPGGVVFSPSHAEPQAQAA